MRPFRIQDIAKKANVSPSTVSRVLNNKGTVTDTTRKRVIAAAREMGFEPRRYEKRQGSHRQGHVGIVFNAAFTQNLSFDPFYGEIVQGVESTLSQFGYTLFFKTIRSGESLNEFVRNQEISGLLFVGYEIENTVVRHITELGIPIVLIDNELWDENVDCVVTDNISGTRRMVSHLTMLDHRDIAFLCGPLRYASLRERYIGYKQALKTAGLQKHDALCVFFDQWDPVANGYDGVMEVFHTRGLRPSALFAVNDDMAMGALRALRDLGLSVPDDVSVAGFDDVKMSGVIHPALTTVRVFKREMGTLAAKRLCEIIDRSLDRPIKLTVSADLVLRESTKAYQE